MESFDELKWYKEALHKALKPCPFCGETENIGITFKDEPNISMPPTNTTHLTESVQCFKCGAKITKAFGVGVVNSWNQRK